MTEVIINYWAVLIAGAAQMVVGFIYYSPGVLGKTWMKLSNISHEEAKSANMGKTYVLSFVASLVTAYVLAHFVQYAKTTTWSQGVQTGFWAWLGFVAPVSAMEMLYGNKSFKLYALGNGYHLISLLIMGGILASWI